MIQKFDISPRQARVAIVEYAKSASLSIAFDNYGSKTRLMCAVKDLGYLGNKRSYKFLMTNTRFCLLLVLRRLYYHFFLFQMDLQSSEKDCNCPEFTGGYHNRKRRGLDNKTGSYECNENYLLFRTSLIAGAHNLVAHIKGTFCLHKPDPIL